MYNTQKTSKKSSHLTSPHQYQNPLPFYFQSTPIRAESKSSRYARSASLPCFLPACCCCSLKSTANTSMGGFRPRPSARFQRFIRAIPIQGCVFLKRGFSFSFWFACLDGRMGREEREKGDFGGGMGGGSQMFQLTPYWLEISKWRRIFSLMVRSC